MIVSICDFEGNSRSSGWERAGRCGAPMRPSTDASWLLAIALALLPAFPSPSAAFRPSHLPISRQPAPFPLRDALQKNRRSRPGDSVRAQFGCQMLLQSASPLPLSFQRMGWGSGGARGQAMLATSRGTHPEVWARRDAVFSFVGMAASTLLRLGRAVLGLLLALFSDRPTEQRPVSSYSCSLHQLSRLDQCAILAKR